MRATDFTPGERVEDVDPECAGFGTVDHCMACQAPRRCRSVPVLWDVPAGYLHEVVCASPRWLRKVRLLEAP